MSPDEIAEIRAMDAPQLAAHAPIMVPNLISIIEILAAQVAERDAEIEQLNNLLGDVQSAALEMVEGQAIYAGIAKTN